MKNKKSFALRAAVICMAFYAAVSVSVPQTKVSAANNAPTAAASALSNENRVPAYAEYRKAISASSAASKEITVQGIAYSDATGDVKAENGRLLTGSNSTVEWAFEVPAAGYYNIEITYYPTVSKGGSIERTLTVDGKVPFDEARYIEFPRFYRDGEIKANAKGDDVTPEQLEAPRESVYTFQDADHFIAEDLAVYLDAGTRRIALIANKEKLEISQIRLIPEKKAPTYEQYRQSIPSKDISDADTVCIQAEEPSEKSTFTIYPTSDKSSAATYPQDSYKTRLNMISGDKWGRSGQRLSWEIDVKTAGYYNIALRFKQDTYDGGFVSRKLYIDGKCPFEEAARLRFHYSDSWTVQALGGEEPYLFYFESGKHTVTLEVVMGDMADIVSDIQNALTALNADYRRILTITGPAPDVYRDYGYESLIPDVLSDLNEQSAVLERAVDALNKTTNVKGDFTNSVTKLIITLGQIKKDPELISELFTTYKDNLSSLGTWLQDIMAQPLDADCLYFVPEGAEIPDSGDSFFKNFWFKTKMFFSSFVRDYWSFSSDITQEEFKSGKVLSVWMTNGREQCQIMQKLIEQYFTPQTGVKANVQLVAANALLPSVLAGTGPDLAMNVPSSTPIDFAMRGAAVDLSGMEGFDELCARFNPAAITPFTFNGSVYAIPETMTFLMMFYRTDIFSELSLEAPKTWNEFYEVVWELQQANLDVGFPINAKTNVVSNMNLYGLELFLYQQGGSLYNSDYTASAMSQNLNAECFEKMAELFTLYKFPVDYDFANRFRSGEMPLGIVEYSMYNQLTIFASEIKGLWRMTTVPGTVQEDGSVNFTSPAASSGIMMLEKSRNKKNAWAFIRWVTSDEIQSRYANEIESVLGAAAKHATANLNAVGSMSWTDEEYAALSKQIEALQGTPEIPGGYYTARAIDFAFASVYTGSKDPETALLNQVKLINDEITRKRKEFGMDE